jgi:3-oxoacyl-[acyl-carrier protein] reductase
MNVLITGVSRGIGKALLQKFIENGAEHVFGISRNASKLLENQKFNQPNLHLIDFDADTDEPEAIYDVLNAKVNKIDILINNAGLLVNKPFQDISNEEIQSVYNVNVIFPFRLTQAVLPLLKTSPKAHVINISSMGGVQGSAKFSGLSAYSSSKAAIAGLSECLAEELKPFNIHVNALAIGAVQTEMLQEAFPDYKAPLTAMEMADYVFQFATESRKYFNGKIVSVSSTTP